MNTEINWMPQGWECPKCGAVMSPTTSCCINCSGITGGNATTIINPTIDYIPPQSSTGETNKLSPIKTTHGKEYISQDIFTEKPQMKKQTWSGGR